MKTPWYSDKPVDGGMTEKNDLDLFSKAAEDHYFDSLEKDKDLIIKHLMFIASLYFTRTQRKP